MEKISQCSDPPTVLEPCFHDMQWSVHAGAQSPSRSRLGPLITLSFSDEPSRKLKYLTYSSPSSVIFARPLSSPSADS